jgi:hypothetical protein
MFLALQELCFSSYILLSIKPLYTFLFGSNMQSTTEPLAMVRRRVQAFVRNPSLALEVGKFSLRSYSQVV